MTVSPLPPWCRTQASGTVPLSHLVFPNLIRTKIWMLLLSRCKSRQRWVWGSAVWTMSCDGVHEGLLALVTAASMLDPSTMAPSLSCAHSFSFLYVVLQVFQSFMALISRLSACDEYKLALFNQASRGLDGLNSYDNMINHQCLLHTTVNSQPFDVLGIAKIGGEGFELLPTIGRDAFEDVLFILVFIFNLQNA